MSTWDPYDEPEFEGIYELPVRDRPVMSPPPRLLPTRKLIDQVRVACDLDEATAERVAHWAADWGERLGARTARPVIETDGSGPHCSWCSQIWPLCGHHHQCGEDHEGTPWLASLTPAFDSAQSVPYWRDIGITSWQVLWTPEQDQFTTKETK